MADVLFEVTRDNLETGLRGYPVGYCTTSSVDPQKGLFYSGIPVDQLVDWDPIAVIYLLQSGKRGSVADVEEFKQELVKRSRCEEDLHASIRKLPRRAHPMQLFAMALVLAGVFEGKNDYCEDGINLIAKIPEIAATVINYHAGWNSLRPSDPSLGYMENFVHMLNPPGVEGAEQKRLCQVMRLFDILHFDHGGGNLSTFVGKAVASGLENMYGSIAAAMHALAGARHGGANQDCLEFVQEIARQLGPHATGEQVESLIDKKLNNNELVFGFGHAVLRVEDPRATVLYDIAEQYYPDYPLVKIAGFLRTHGSKALQKRPKIANPYPNIDAISGILLTAAGLPHPEYYTVLFGMSRSVGIALQIIYERCEARDGKGTPIVRPKYIYKAKA